MIDFFTKVKRASKKIFSLVTRIRVRHVRMGFPALFRLARWHLFGDKVSLNSSGNSNWLVCPPTISILITVYNQTALELARAIESARFQQGTSFEILIVDDGSTNIETTKFLQDLQLRTNEKIFFEPNQGVVKARNFLIAKVTTDYLVFLDPDDAFDEKYLSRVVDLLLKSRHIEIVYPNVLVHDISYDSFEIWETGPFDPETLAKVNVIPLSLVVSVKLIRMLGGFAEDFQSGFEDWDLWYRASLSRAITKHLPEIGYVYTKAPVSRTSIMSNNSDLIFLRGAGPNSHFPFSKKAQIDVFLTIPFLPRIGGVEKYVKILTSDIQSAGLSVAIVITETDPLGYLDDADSYRSQGNIVVKRSDFPAAEHFIEGLRTLSKNNSIAINFGSPWVFENILDFNSIFSKNVGFVFNNEISQERVEKSASYFDEIWVAYSELVNTFPEKQRSKVFTIYTGIVDKSEIVRGERISNQFTIGFMGRLSIEKDPEKFLEIAFLARNLENLKFKVGGEGPLEQKIKKKVDSMENVEYVGFVENAQEFLSSLDCLLITSEVEGIPLVAMEALSLGVPVVSTKVGGMHEVVTSKTQGSIWNGSADDGLEAVLEILKNSRNSRTIHLLDEKFMRANTFRNVLERLNVLRNL
jgi:glycosyltransferase involved in cell wall biosynthesis